MATLAVARQAGMTVARFSGIILAGGSSRRMGRDKALLPYPGDSGYAGDLKKPWTFLDQLVHVLSACCSEVLIVARDGEQASRYAYTGRRVVLDSIPGGGPLVGLASGLEASSSPSALLVAVDMPFVVPRLLAFLFSLYQDETILLPRVNGYPQVTLAIYPRSILPLIDDLIRQGRRDLRSLVDVDMSVRYVDEEELRRVDPSLRSFTGINTPEELRQS